MHTPCILNRIQLTLMGEMMGILKGFASEFLLLQPVEGRSRYFIQEFKEILVKYLTLLELDPAIVEARSDYYIVSLYLYHLGGKVPSGRNLEEVPEAAFYYVFGSVPYFSLESPEMNFVRAFNNKLAKFGEEHGFFDTEYALVFIVCLDFDFSVCV